MHAARTRAADVVPGRYADDEPDAGVATRSTVPPSPKCRPDLERRSRLNSRPRKKRRKTRPSCATNSVTSEGLISASCVGSFGPSRSPARRYAGIAGEPEATGHEPERAEKPNRDRELGQRHEAPFFPLVGRLAPRSRVRLAPSKSAGIARAPIRRRGAPGGSRVRSPARSPPLRGSMGSRDSTGYHRLCLSTSSFTSSKTTPRAAARQRRRSGGVAVTLLGECARPFAAAPRGPPPAARSREVGACTGEVRAWPRDMPQHSAGSLGLGWEVASQRVESSECLPRARPSHVVDGASREGRFPAA